MMNRTPLDYDETLKRMTSTGDNPLLKNVPQIIQPDNSLVANQLGIDYMKRANLEPRVHAQIVNQSIGFVKVNFVNNFL